MKTAPAPRSAASGLWRRHGGLLAPWAGVFAVVLLVLLLGEVSRFGHARFPLPQLELLKDYPHVKPDEAARIAEAVLRWVVASVFAWLVGLVTVAVCAWRLQRALARHREFVRRALGTLLLALAGLALLLVGISQAAGKPLMSFDFLLQSLHLITPGFGALASLNTGLGYVVGFGLLVSLSLVLHERSHEGEPEQQLRALTLLLYVGAAFLAVWIAAAVSMYRLAAQMHVAAARDAALALAPTIGLVAGAVLSLLLLAAYLAGCAWLYWRHGAFRPGASALPGLRQRFGEHWPKLVAVLTPLLPGLLDALSAVVAPMR